jgi:cytoskeletal protein RodZ
VGSFGEKLRREREMRGISLDEIATATKIGTRSLKALEDEKFSILPGGIFNKGFVRSYARYLGMNEDEAVADYQAAMKEQPVSVKTIAAQSAMARANRLAAQQRRESSRTGGILRALLLLVLSGTIAFGGYTSYRRGYFKALKLPSLHRQMKKEAVQAPATVTPAPSTDAVVGTAVTSTAAPVTPSPAAPTVPVAAQAAPVTTQAETQVAAQPAAENHPAHAGTAPELIAEDHTTIGVPKPRAVAAGDVVLSIKASERCWLSVAADGKRALHRTLRANQQQTVTARDHIRVTLGNPGSTELLLNGHPLALNGDLSHPRIFTVDATGVVSE